MAKNTERDYQIKLNAKQNAHAEFEGWPLKRLKNEIIKLRKENALLEEKLNSFTKNSASQSNVPKASYNQKWTYPQKICFILLNQQQAMGSSQIYNTLLKADTHFEDFRNPLAILNSYLSRMIKSGRLISKKLPGIKKHFYILPEWIEEDGKLKAEYVAHLNFLS